MDEEEYRYFLERIVSGYDMKPENKCEKCNKKSECEIGSDCDMCNFCYDCPICAECMAVTQDKKEEIKRRLYEKVGINFDDMVKLSKEHEEQNIADTKPKIETKVIEIKFRPYATISDMNCLCSELQDKLDLDIFNSKLELTNFRTEVKIDNKNMLMFQEITKKYECITWTVVDWW